MKKITTTWYAIWEDEPNEGEEVICVDNYEHIHLCKFKDGLYWRGQEDFTEYVVYWSHEPKNIL